MKRRDTRPPRADRSGEFVSFVARPTSSARMATAADLVAPAAAKPPAPKLEHRVQQSIRDSAKGEECLVRIEGVCRGGTEHTIWSHAPLGAGGKGTSMKALDLCGAFCCTACDAVVDGQAKAPEGVTRVMVLLSWMYGHMRSLVRLRQKGLV